MAQTSSDVPLLPVLQSNPEARSLREPDILEPSITVSRRRLTLLRFCFRIWRRWKVNIMLSIAMLSVFSIVATSLFCEVEDRCRWLEGRVLPMVVKNRVNRLYPEAPGLAGLSIMWIVVVLSVAFGAIKYGVRCRSIAEHLAEDDPERVLYLMESQLGARLPPSRCSLCFFPACAIAGYKHGDPCVGIFDDRDARRACLLMFCCACPGSLYAALRWQPNPVDIRGDGKHRYVGNPGKTACLLGPSCTVSFWESGDLCLGQCHGDACRLLPFAIVPALFFALGCCVIAIPPDTPDEHTGGIVLACWIACLLFIVVPSCAVACCWRRKARHFVRGTHMHGGSDFQAPLIGSPVQVAHNDHQAATMVSDTAKDYVTLQDLQIRPAGAIRLKYRGKLDAQELQDACLAEFKARSDVSAGRWHDGVLYIADISKMILDGPVEYEPAPGITSFQKKSWLVFKDMHVDLSCGQQVGEYRGCLGQVWCIEECLSLVQGRLDVTHAMWRKDTDGVLHIFDLSARFNAGPLRHHYLKGVVSFHASLYRVPAIDEEFSDSHISHNP